MLGYIFIRDKWYDFYIDFDVPFSLLHIDSMVAYSLVFVHLLILLLLGYNKRK